MIQGPCEKMALQRAPMDSSIETPSRVLSERRLLLLLAAVQFTHIMDFRVMIPLGPRLMRQQSVSPQQFGSLISSSAITAGLAGFSSAPFIDRSDRRHLLLFAYAGFTVGTLAAILAAGACLIIGVLTSSGPRPEWQVLVIAGSFSHVRQRPLHPQPGDDLNGSPSARRAPT